MKQQLTGAELITVERERQINEEGWTATHDADKFHSNGEMAMVACCYASPIPLYVYEKRSKGGYPFTDPYVEEIHFGG